MYLDVYGPSANLGNMRLATRSSVNTDGIGAYKSHARALPPGPRAPGGLEHPSPADGRRRIILTDVPATKLYLSWTGGSYATPASWPKMYTCGANVFYYDIPKGATAITVNNRDETPAFSRTDVSLPRLRPPRIPSPPSPSPEAMHNAQCTIHDARCMIHDA